MQKKKYIYLIYLKYLYKKKIMFLNQIFEVYLYIMVVFILYFLSNFLEWP